MKLDLYFLGWFKNKDEAEEYLCILEDDEELNIQVLGTLFRYKWGWCVLYWSSQKFSRNDLTVSGIYDQLLSEAFF